MVSHSKAVGIISAYKQNRRQTPVFMTYREARCRVPAIEISAPDWPCPVESLSVIAAHWPCSSHTRFGFRSPSTGPSRLPPRNDESGVVFWGPLCLPSRGRLVEISSKIFAASDWAVHCQCSPTRCCRSHITVLAGLSMTHGSNKSSPALDFVAWPSARCRWVGFQSSSRDPS